MINVLLSFVLIIAPIVLLIWLWVTVLHQQSEINRLQQQQELLASKVFAENRQPASPTQSASSQNAQYSQAQPSMETPTYTPQPAPPRPQPYTYQPHKPAAVEQQPKKDVESWLGRNVIGIMASILVFIGIIFLGVLAYEHITDTGKIIAMYVISAVVLALSIWLTVKKSNNFTLILTGCGAGSFFISILLTHVYFNRINDVVAFSLLLVWMVATLLLAKKFTSIHLSITAHIGMAISICFAFAQGLSDEKLTLLLIYQGAAIAIILLGNIFCCKRTYNFGIFVSFSLTIIASGYMWGNFAANNSTYPFTTFLPTVAVAGAFIAQFLCGSFLSYLLSVSTTRLKNASAQIAIHFSNKALWIVSLIMNVYFVVYRIANTTSDPLQTWMQRHLSAILIAVLITLAVIVIHAALTMLLSLKFSFDGKLETISILLLSCVASILLLILWSSNQRFGFGFFMPRITWLIVITLLLILASHITKNKTYSIAATITLTLDAAFMLAGGYRYLTNVGTILLSLGYLVLYITTIWLQWYLLDAEEREKYSRHARIFVFFLTELSLIGIILTSPLEYKTEILLITLTALNTILYAVRFDREAENSSVMRYVFGANEFVLLSIVSCFIAFDDKDSTSTILYFVLAALAFGLAFIRIRKVLYGSSNKVEGIWTGLKLTMLALAIIQGNTSWFDQAYIFSIVCMLTALVCIILGFIGRAKTLRFYGLALTLLSIIKLVTYDVTNLNTPLRVLTFIGGGVICFIISAIYNYTAKKLEVSENNNM